MLIGLFSTCSTGSLGFGKSLASNGIKCLSWKNQTSQVSLMFTDKNSNEPLYYSFTVSVNKYGGSFTTI